MILSKLETLKLLRVSLSCVAASLIYAVLYLLTNILFFIYLFNISCLLCVIPLLLCCDYHNKDYRYSFNELKTGVLN